MDIMHGSLDKLVNKIDANTIIKIIKRIAYYLHCLYFVLLNFYFPYNINQYFNIN